MTEKVLSRNSETRPIPPDWDKPFAELFPILSLPLDINFLRNIEVPENFFPAEHVSGKLEQNFIYFLMKLTVSADASEETQKTKAELILRLLWDQELSIAIQNKRSGFNQIKNQAFYSVYKELGLMENLPMDFRVEAESFAHILMQLGLKANEFLAEENSQPSNVEHTVKELIKIGAALTPNEVLSILENGPIANNVAKAWKVNGEPSVDGQELTDQQVGDFIADNFPVDLNNNQIKIGRITGSQQILFVNWETWTDEELSEAEYQQKIDELGVEEAYNRTVLSFINNKNEWHLLQLFNFCQNIPEMAVRILASLDYLNDSWSIVQKRITYALGILVHEFVHRLQTNEVLDAYKQVSAKTWGKPELPWQGYPSEYVFLYATAHDADEELLLKEDLADSVQIYVINSAYLKTHYPERFDFIQQKFPHITPDSAQKYFA